MKKILLSIIIASFLFLSANLVYADEFGGSNTDNTTCVASADKVCISNPLGNKVTSINALIGNIIKGLLGVVGSLALVMFVWGGFQWMTSAGDAKKVTSGRDTMLWAAAGLLIIFASYGLVKFVITTVGGS
jgi:hypothetical protein